MCRSQNPTAADEGVRCLTGSSSENPPPVSPPPLGLHASIPAPAPASRWLRRRAGLLLAAAAAAAHGWTPLGATCLVACSCATPARSRSAGAERGVMCTGQALTAMHRALGACSSRKVLQPPTPSPFPLVVEFLCARMHLRRCPKFAHASMSNFGCSLASTSAGQQVKGPARPKQQAAQSSMELWEGGEGHT